MTSKRPKPQHIDKSMRVDGKITKEHRLVIKTADLIFNNTPLRERSNVKRPGKKRK